MPVNIISQLYSYRRVRIAGQRILDKGVLEIDLKPDRRYIPLCSCCGSKCRRIHSTRKRSLRDK